MSHCVSSVANRTVDQTNIVGDTAAAGANEVSQANIEGVENVAASTGMVNQVSNHGNAGSHHRNMTMKRTMMDVLLQQQVKFCFIDGWFQVSHQVELFLHIKHIRELQCVFL